MKKNNKIAILIGFVILFGILLSSLFVYLSYSRVIKDNTKNVAELSTMNIFSEINTELTKPIYVSLTMANDTFLQNWIEYEDSNDVNDVVEYLNGIKEKYDYNSVFLVSKESSNYYYFDGINKVVSPTNEHDVWYYDFLANDSIYELDVDVDEVTSALTIFVNVKVYDSSGDVSAVVGVGLEMEQIQEIMSSFEDEYTLDAYLVDNDGLVQSHSDTENIETLNLFTLLDPELKSTVLSQRKALNTVTSNHDETYIISRLIDEIDWHLVIIKDANTLSRFIRDYFLATMIMVAVVIGLVLYIVDKSLKGYQDKVYTMAKTDYLTLLLNRRGFDDEYKSYHSSKEALVFITDIDRFKVINDEYGHSVGDKILRQVARIIDQEVSQYGKLSRWGGDEFTGVMVGKRQELEQTLKRIFELISNNEQISQYGLSISLGYTYTTFDTDLDIVLNKADQGLYKAKSKGGNTIEYIK